MFPATSGPIRLSDIEAARKTEAFAKMLQSMRDDVAVGEALLAGLKK